MPVSGLCKSCRASAACLTDLAEPGPRCVPVEKEVSEDKAVAQWNAEVCASVILSSGTSRRAVCVVTP